MSEEENNNQIPIDKSKNIRVILDNTPKERELAEKLEKANQQIGALLNQHSEEFHEAIDRKPAPMGGETCPLDTAEYYQYKEIHVPNCEYETTPSEPLSNVSDFTVKNQSDGWEFISKLAKQGNLESQKAIENMQRKAMKTMRNKEAVLQGGLCRWKTENGKVVRQTEKPYFRVEKTDE